MEKMGPRSPLFRVHAYRQSYKLIYLSLAFVGGSERIPEARRSAGATFDERLLPYRTKVRRLSGVDLHCTSARCAPADGCRICLSEGGGSAGG
jgi:hypothetical protein